MCGNEKDEGAEPRIASEGTPCPLHVRTVGIPGKGCLPCLCGTLLGGGKGRAGGTNSWTFLSLLSTLTRPGTNRRKFAAVGRHLGRASQVLLVIHILLHLFSFPNLAQGLRSTKGSGLPHRCYVCLPADKTSSEAHEILSLFADTHNIPIPDCEGFSPENAHEFEFTCPPKYIGCLRRSLGNNRALVSRTCVNLAIDDCKVANTIEYCYCSGELCNGEKKKDTSSPRQSPGKLNSDITDDEDLLGVNHPEGSGDDHLRPREDGEPEMTSPSRSAGGNSGENLLKPANISSSPDFRSSSHYEEGDGDAREDSSRKSHSGLSIPASSNKGEKGEGEESAPASHAPATLARASTLTPMIILGLFIPHISSLVSIRDGPLFILLYPRNSLQ